MQHSSHKRRDGRSKPHLGSLLNIPFAHTLKLTLAHRIFLLTLIYLVLNVDIGRIALLLPFVKRLTQLIHRRHTAALVAPIAKVDEHCHHYNDKQNYSHYHQVELLQRVVELFGTRLKKAVLSGAFLHVEIDVAVVVALWFVVHSRINYAHLLAHGSHKVGGCVHSSILAKGVLQANECRLVVVYRTVGF